MRLASKGVFAGAVLDAGCGSGNRLRLTFVSYSPIISAVTADLIPEVVVEKQGFGWPGFDPHREVRSLGIGWDIPPYP